MLWLELLTLPDGSRVESGLLSADENGTGRAARAYRLSRVDGSVTEFASLATILRQLVDQYDPAHLRVAAGSREGVASELVVQRRHHDDLPSTSRRPVEPHARSSNERRDGQKDSTAATPSWVEQRAWILACPTCQAPVGHACVGMRDGTQGREFNHHMRNLLALRYREEQRATERHPAPGSGTG